MRQRVEWARASGCRVDHSDVEARHALSRDTTLGASGARRCTRGALGAALAKGPQDLREAGS